MKTFREKGNYCETTIDVGPGRIAWFPALWTSKYVGLSLIVT